MIKIKCFTVNMLEENCYVLSDDTHEAVIIDDGAYIRGEHQAIDHYIVRENLIPKHVLNTHGHFDHTLGNFHLYQTYGLKPEMSTADADLYDHLSLQIQSILGRKLKVEVVSVEHFLHDGDTIRFGNHQLQVIETPGHTPGGICLYCRQENILFSGDSLFRQSIGRTDFPGGNALSLISSLKERVMTLPDSTKVYPGHGEPTTIGEERYFNPYFRN